MDHASDGAGALNAVAAQLREHRRVARLTLESAAARAGLSPAHLSRLETGRRQPSLPVLLALARLYGTTVSDLLGETGAESEPVVRGGEAEAVPAGGWVYRAAGNPSRALQALRVTVPPRVEGDLVRVHPGEEWLYVLSGTLALALGERSYTLAPGDSAHFDSLVPHRIAALGGHSAEMLFVHTLLRSAATNVCLGGAGPTPGL
ncbi:helix-turn-helix transcriptional regulator [Streptomyces sp. NA04227]|uniref:helix-turn-helix domain-containing protein n=1 Tax=Streptomyces sp. NA04227 TaxID=2742136 RepID=UPI001591BCBD|nr:XRE family transcriptional regulator [Streptomyces sp. NA04227]QKW05027.1 helix-turn-helix transcriptional regulator [Streptomyces sp. NA04227]